MKTDARVAHFGGSYTEEGLGSVSRSLHPQHAALYVFGVTNGGFLSLYLPSIGFRNGTVFTVWNKSSGTGIVNLIVPGDTPLTLTLEGPAGGSEDLAKDQIARVYHGSTAGWVAYAFDIGPRPILS